MTAQLRVSARRMRRRGNWTAWAFVAPVVIYLLVFYAYPLARNVELSVRAYTVRSFIDGTAPFVGLANYQAVFANSTFGPALLNTGLFVGVSILFQFSIGLALAVFFIRNFPLGGNNFTQALVKGFKLTFTKAENLKRHASESKYAREVFQAMRPLSPDDMVCGQYTGYRKEPGQQDQDGEKGEAPERVRAGWVGHGSFPPSEGPLLLRRAAPVN